MENSEKKLERKMQFIEFFFNLCKTIWENEDSEYIPEDARYRTLKLNSENYPYHLKNLSTSISLQSSLWFTVSFGAIVCHGVTIREHW